MSVTEPYLQLLDGLHDEHVQFLAGSAALSQRTLDRFHVLADLRDPNTTGAGFVACTRDRLQQLLDRTWPTAQIEVSLTGADPLLTEPVLSGYRVCASSEEPSPASVSDDIPDIYNGHSVPYRALRNRFFDNVVPTLTLTWTQGPSLGTDLLGQHDEGLGQVGLIVPVFGAVGADLCLTRSYRPVAVAYGLLTLAERTSVLSMLRAPLLRTPDSAFDPFLAALALLELPDAQGSLPAQFVPARWEAAELACVNERDRPLRRREELIGCARRLAEHVDIAVLLAG